MKIIVLASFLALAHTTLGFINLSEAERYAASVPEFPLRCTAESGYHKLYASLKPSWWDRTLSAVGLRKKPAWKPEDAQKLIEFLSKDLKPVTTHTLTAASGTDLIIFGGLHGAFHSLTRSLTDLHSRALITQEFVVKPETYLIFLGDTLDSSAYSLESLSLILTLLRANREQVIFLAGQRESKQMWHSNGLKKELDLRIPHKAEELTQKLDTLFARLPKELIISLKGTPETVHFSAFPHDKESRIPVLITGDAEAPNYQEGQGLYKQISQEGDIVWKIVSSPVRGYRMRQKFFYDAYAQSTLGNSLEMSTISCYSSSGSHPFTHGSTYNLRSGSLVTRGRALPAVTAQAPRPVTLSQMAQSISTLQEQTNVLSELVTLIDKQVPHSAFAQIPMESTPILTKLKKGTPLTEQELQAATFEVELLYNTFSAEVDTLLNKAEQKGLSIELSQAASEEAHTITIGSTLDLSKSAKGLGMPFKSGMALKTNKKNREGGIHNKRVNIIFLDDGYLPASARKNIETLRTVYETPYILAPVGSPTLAGFLDLVKDKKILVLFPQSGSLLFRKPDLTHIINFRASFNDEGHLLTEFVLKNYRPKNFAFFYQDDEFGISILEGAKEALKSADITPATEVRYQANTSNFEAAAAKIKEANPDAIGFFATGPATLQLIRDLGVEFLANKILYAVSSVGDTATMKVLKDWGLSMIIGQVVPDPATSKLPLVEEYRKELKKQGLKEDAFSLETYITTSLTFNAMSKIEEPISMEKLIDFFEKMKNYEYKGLKLTFNPQSRSLAQSLWIIDKDGTTKEMSIGGIHEVSRS